jgi:hypothetical protein
LVGSSTCDSFGAAKSRSATLGFLIPTVVAELSLALWLVVKGVDVTRFRQVSMAGYQASG